jgi:hypothetical protein
MRACWPRRGKGEEEPPISIMVATGSPADLVASVTDGLEGVEFVDGTLLKLPRERA